MTSESYIYQYRYIWSNPSSIDVSAAGSAISMAEYNNPDTYNYDPANGILLDQSMPQESVDKAQLIDDLSKMIPDYINGLLSSFPAGALLEDGSLNTAYDFSNLPYFNVMKYAPDGSINEILKPDGSSVTYSDNMPKCMISGADTTAPAFTN